MLGLAVWSKFGVDLFNNRMLGAGIREQSVLRSDDVKCV